MASAAQLVEALSKVTGIPIATVVDIDRKLAAANLRTKTGRGRHAAQMTPLDAARLLTAVLAAPQANAAASTVQRYARTAVEVECQDTLFGPAEIEELALLSPTHSFVDGLSALISSLSGGELREHTWNFMGDWLPQIEVFALTRATRGTIRLGRLPEGRSATVEYSLPSIDVPQRLFYWPDGNYFIPEDPLGDLDQTRRVTSITVISIARILAGDTILGDYGDE